jgi:hypothetical protein
MGDAEAHGRVSDTLLLHWLEYISGFVVLVLIVNEPDTQAISLSSHNE